MSTADDERVELAAVFADHDVAANYYDRPPHPPALFATLLATTRGRDRALDLGTGPGKIARVLADHFDEVVAVDPSEAMLAVGRAADAGAHPNLHWVLGRAEDYADAGRFDIATAGDAVHWFDSSVLFPKLARWTDVFAVSSDAPIFPHPAPPCGMPAWLVFLNRWAPRMGRPRVEAPPEPDWPPRPAQPHEAWMQIAGRERFRYRFRQTVEAFIAGNHARVSWNRPAMGQALADAFDQDLDALLRPFAVDGRLEIESVSDLVWGRPLAVPRR